MDLEALGGWPGVLRRLSAGDDLTAEEAGAALTDILLGNATPALIAGFVMALRTKGETVEEISGLVDAMLDQAERVAVPGGLDPIDTCGTGGGAGRRAAAFNVSTIASFVIAGAGGAVCKHGNRAASSTSGSADVLEALGVVIDLGPDGVARCLGETRMAFCFAQRFHPAMRHAGATRRELGVPTVFNVLGPLANPAGVRRQVLGVSDPAMLDRLARVLVARRVERAFVVHGHDGLDELSTAAPSTVLDVQGGEVRRIDVDPTELGIDRAEGLVPGGDAATNADLARRVLAGERGAHRDVVVLNAAAGLVVAGVAGDLAEGVARAGASIDDGQAAGVLDALVATSQAAATD